MTVRSLGFAPATSKLGAVESLSGRARISRPRGGCPVADRQTTNDGHWQLISPGNSAKLNGRQLRAAPSAKALLVDRAASSSGHRLQGALSAANPLFET